MRQIPPSGTITFLFTDIEGSTALWERDPERMRAQLARHEEILRDAFEAHGGYVFKTLGDGLCVAFGRAPDAVAAAVAGQEELTRASGAEDVADRVRMALHTDHAEAREGDYFGRGLNRVARLMATGHGGQTLLSGTTADLVEDALPDGAALVDLGEHRLRDLERPENVFQLDREGESRTFPPLTSLSALPHNLPRQLSSFVGRERELQKVKELLAEHRLVTLTGPGGCGKTRLALQVAADLAETYPDGVWFIELAALTDPSLVTQKAASAMGLREVPGRSLTESLTGYLESRTPLVVLDNCEHLVEACADLATTLLQAGTSVSVLATSREALGAPGEQVWLVPSLSIGSRRKGTRETKGTPMEVSDAVRLFVERAALARSDFRTTDADAGSLLHICDRLDGIPLAIELAAARVKVLSLDQIAARLDDRFRLLTGGRRTALPRHQTLRAAMDWSHDLLDASERILFRRLSVFAGGWTLEAAETVCAGVSGGLETSDVLDLLARLVDKSLVPAERADTGEVRYRMLETTRQYGLERLVDAGEASELRRRHHEWFRGFAARAVDGLTGDDPAPWIDALEQEHDNLRAALEWSLARESTAVDGLRLAQSMWRFWLRRGYVSEGIEWLGRALEATSSATVDDRCAALLGLANLSFFHGDVERVRSVTEEGLELAGRVEDRTCVARLLNAKGIVSLHDGDPAAAVAVLERARSLARETGARRHQRIAVMNLGEARRMLGELEEARSLYERALELGDEIGDRSQDDVVLLNLGQVLLESGDVDAAEKQYRDGLELGRRRKKKTTLVNGLSQIAQTFAARGEHARAVRLFGAAAAARDDVGVRIDPADRPLYERSLEMCREALGDAAVDALWEEGARITLEEALDGVLAPSTESPAE